jgi:regulator of sirC expression with transglutaminase-like and TPR domain
VSIQYLTRNTNAAAGTTTFTTAVTQAVYADPNNPNVWCSLGVLYYQLQQNRDALDAYTRAIKLDPNLCEVWYNVGTLYDSCGQTADALDAYKKAAELGASGDFIHQRIKTLMKKVAPGTGGEGGNGLQNGLQNGPPPAGTVTNSGSGTGSSSGAGSAGLMLPAAGHVSRHSVGGQPSQKSQQQQQHR